MRFTTSEKAIEAIKGFEGCRLRGYRCPAGVATVGYGNTSHAVVGVSITQEQAEAWLAEDLDKCERYVNTEGVATTQGQFDALVDFVFNLGAAALRKSTLLKYIRVGRPAADIQAQFRLWCHSGGRKLKGLEIRCEWRADRWVEND